MNPYQPSHRARFSAVIGFLLLLTAALSVLYGFSPVTPAIIRQTIDGIQLLVIAGTFIYAVITFFQSF